MATYHGPHCIVFTTTAELTAYTFLFRDVGKVVLDTQAENDYSVIYWGVTGLTALFELEAGGAGDALTTNPLSQFAATTSAQLRGVLSDETGTGAAYFQNGALGTPASGVLTNCTGTAAALTAGQTTAALGIKSATTTVDVQSATAPSSGQVLTATGASAATWQTPSSVASLRSDFRLTGKTGTPVMDDSEDCAQAFLTPFVGNRIALYDGAAWAVYTSAEVSGATFSGFTANIPVDVFVYDSGGGTLALEYVNWTNATTRATGITVTNGVKLKTGTLTRRYVGTMLPYSTDTVRWRPRITGGSAIAYVGFYSEDNQVPVAFRIVNAASTHNYTTNSWTEFRGGTYKLYLVAGELRNCVHGTFLASAANSTASILRSIGIGLGSDVPTDGFANGTGPANVHQSMTVVLGMQQPLGAQEYRMLYRSTATGTCTWAASSEVGFCGTWVC